MLLAPPGRFELPAFRLGGGPSIQLRYGGKWGKYSVFMQKWIRTTCRLGGVCSIQLSYCDVSNFLYIPENSRTQILYSVFPRWPLQRNLRRRMLYPAELRAHGYGFRGRGPHRTQVYLTRFSRVCQGAKKSVFRRFSYPHILPLFRRKCKENPSISMNWKK